MSQSMVGGQAVIEGVMMRSPRSMAVAVRRADGSIAVREGQWSGLFGRFPLLRKPFLRGGVVLLEALHNGMSALRWSAEQAGQDDPAAASGKGNGAAPAQPAEPASSWALNTTMVVSILLAFGLFIGLPHVLGLIFGKLFGLSFMDGQSVPFHIVAGCFKVAIFLTYITLIARLPEIRRVFQYHGAEHKSIWAFEHEEDLTVDNARKHTRLHPRCGTSFIFIVIMASILVFSIAFGFIPPLVDNGFLNQVLIIAIKLPLLFPIAGLAYEVQRYSARHTDSPWVRPLIWPGLMLQKITTQEPDDSQLEVALAALKTALVRERAGTAMGSAAPEWICSVYRSYLEIDAPQPTAAPAAAARPEAAALPQAAA